ncbi:Protein saf4 [Daldinia childiae]|uniref:Protein saf4 n=1 Tax=Daldinia childiae TaxID=326645 RepID=UPI0014482AC5|nr:Protein saf4 [Daldinia childiae]KAF3060914.1 Protein saf4 [Daldinia childiae]
MQGFNMGRYVPPDVEGTTTGNKLHKKRPPGFSGGQQTVRFEMPFAIWCAHCPQPTLIAQGVRFNAAKRKVGSYHSTPIFAFLMTHTACSGAIEIRTDPEHTTYAVTSGARRRDTGSPDPLSQAILTDKERESLRANAFAKLEKTIADRKVLEDAKERIDELELESARHWEDPYEQNRRLRAAFRVGRKERERDVATAENLRERMSLGIELLAATDEDARRAKLVDFGPSSDTAGGEMGRKALAKPLFSTGSASGSGSGADTKDDKRKKMKSKKLKSEVAAAQMKDSLVSEIVGNTRVAQDPFLSLDRSNGDSNKGPPRIVGIKRKRREPEPEPESQDHEEPRSSEKIGVANTEREGKGTVSLTSLVEYDSD